jgi:hypothetical protein
MIFLIFSQLLKNVFRPKSKENTFLEIKLNFHLTGKYFMLTNFYNGKQTHENLKNSFQITTFWANKRPLKPQILSRTYFYFILSDFYAN